MPGQAGQGDAGLDVDEVKEACGRCDGPLSWIDEAWVCSSGCTYCVDCKDELGGACINCSEMLKRIQRTRRIQPIRRPPTEIG
ncbi:MAG: hypothetical protein QOJ26_319 [Thermoplasmata archaeon]|jgi:hypothetical protein|nr:hypothetical protein [Thermoplasmata archaeon]